jgi:hypothetical protein
MVRALHCVLNRTTTRVGPQSIHNLLGVCYAFTVPADTEFPKQSPHFDVFVRFVAENAGRTRIRIKVWWLPARRDPELLHNFAPERWELDFPLTGRVVMDQPFRVPGVNLTGTGLYAIVVKCKSMNRKRWVRAGVEYFEVEKAQ